MMASSLSCLGRLFFFLMLSLFTSSVVSSTHLLLPLTHTLSHTPTPTHHLLKTSSTRSSTRHHSHRSRQHKQVSLPLSSGSDYTISLPIGNLFMDTGSDLVWTPCSPFKCILCENKSPSYSDHPPPPPNSSLVSCSDPTCSAAHSSLPSHDLCSIADCPLEDLETNSCSPSSSHCPNFYYAYGDGSLIARLRRGPVSLNSLSVPNFTFACAHSALAEPVGVAGFGRGILSLPNQLSPSLGARFSYCLVSHSFQQSKLIKPSPLILGRSTSSSASETTKFIYTPMLVNPKYPYFYSVGLTAITIDDERIAASENLIRVDRNGNGGLVVDSGTTFTILPSDMYGRVSGEFGRRMERVGFVRAERVESETGLSPCYYYLGVRNETRRVPRMGLHFGGNASVELPRGNYFMGFERRGRGVGCLMMTMMMEDAGEGGGPAGTLGNYQQQGFEVVYDLEEGRVGFARRRCGALWDTMSRA